MARVHALRALPDEVSRSLVDVSYPSLPATENGGLLFSFHDEPALLESCAASLLPFEMTAGSAPVAHLHWLLRCDTEEERAVRGCLGPAPSRTNSALLGSLHLLWP